MCPSGTLGVPIMATFQKRGSRWRAIVRKKGHKPTTKSFSTKSAAQRWAGTVETAMERREWGDPVLLRETTVAGIIREYEQQKEIVRSKRTSFNLIESALGDLTLDRLSVNEIVNNIRERAENDGSKPATLALEVTHLADLLKFARTYLKLPVNLETVIDARRLLKDEGIVGKSEERDRRPTSDELSKLQEYWTSHRYLKQAPTPMWDVVCFAIATAMRLSEITRIRWDDFDEDEKTILIRDRKHPTKKQGNNQVVPLLFDSVDIIRRQPVIDERIFPFDPKTISTSFTRTCPRLRIFDLRFHDLRHEGASRLFEAGYQIHEVALVTGHRDWGQLRRYTQLKARDLHR